MTKIRNKFYVAAKSVTTPYEQDQANVKGVSLSVTPHDGSGRWTRNTLQDAVRHAEEVLAKASDLDFVTVVKIVKIVRRVKPKFVIEDVK